jgi:predicted RNase H-like nuclease (RuvC/YqgF family)
MSTLELIDKAIEHCKKCRPDESGHGVTLALLIEIKEGVESKDAEIERLKKELEAAKEEIEELKKEILVATGKLIQSKPI